MSKSKVDNNRKSKHVTTKHTKKSKIMSEKLNVRHRPVWKSQDMLEISGLEFEQVYNFFSNAAQASEAAQAILTRNILNGKISFEFEKEDNGNFVPLSQEEAVPYKEQLNQAIEKAKEAQQQIPKPELKVVE